MRAWSQQPALMFQKHRKRLKNSAARSPSKLYVRGRLRDQTISGIFPFRTLATRSIRLQRHSMPKSYVISDL